VLAQCPSSVSGLVLSRLAWSSPSHLKLTEFTGVANSRTYFVRTQVCIP